MKASTTVCKKVTAVGRQHIVSKGTSRDKHHQYAYLMIPLLHACLLPNPPRARTNPPRTRTNPPDTRKMAIRPDSGATYSRLERNWQWRA